MRENRSKGKQKSQKGGVKILIAILLILVLVAGTLFIMKMLKDKQNTEQTGNGNTIENGKKEEPKPKTFSGTGRLVAFMIDNNINAMPQAGLEQSDLIYEIIVEGGETRLMIVMQDKDLKKIGPLRSARHYFLDYALENDAILVHYGQSPQAKSDITKLGVTDINGINESETSFWRDNSRYAPHNAVTSIANLNKIIERKGFKTTSTKGNVLNYVVDEVELGKTEDLKEGDTSKVKEATKVTIPYSVYNTVKYEYDAETKTYVRYSRDKKQTDWNTKNTITTKNIIITKCKNTTLDDGSGKGRQTLDNIKTLDGYYIPNGKSIPIKCEKSSRSGKTVYKDLEGNEIKVNDGKTFIQICPEDSKISFE